MVWQVYVILAAAASPFSNAGMVWRGNARFLANVLAWSRSPRGAVIFDDAHQGLTAFYDAAAFFAGQRLHATLLWLVLLWLVFVSGSQPMRIRPLHWRASGEMAYSEGSARYLAAVGRPAEPGPGHAPRGLRLDPEADQAARDPGRRW